MLLDGLSNDYFNGRNRSATQKKYNWPRRTQYWLADEKRGRYWHKQRLINCRLIQIIQFLAQNSSAGGRFCLIEKKNELKQKQDWESIQSLYSQSCYPSK